DGRVGRGAGSDVRAGIRVVPGRGKNRDRIPDERGGFGEGSVGGAQVGRGRVVVALHVKRIGRRDGEAETRQGLSILDAHARFGAGRLCSHVGNVERAHVAV